MNLSRNLPLCQTKMKGSNNSCKTTLGSLLPIWLANPLNKWNKCCLKSIYLSKTMETLTDNSIDFWVTKMTSTYLGMALISKARMVHLYHRTLWVTETSCPVTGTWIQGPTIWPGPNKTISRTQINVFPATTQLKKKCIKKKSTDSKISWTKRS